MIRATFRQFPIAATFSAPYEMKAVLHETEPLGGAIANQIYDKKTFRPLFDKRTGRPLVR